MVPRSLEQLAAVLRSGDLTLETYLSELEARIARREPEVLAWVPEANRFERLRADARSLARSFPQARERPPLYGVAVGVKDVFRVEGFPTGAGSTLPVEELEGAESVAVTRLKAAGALVVGKTVSTEFAYFAPGATRNPHDVARTPGGSSSGSAAAVAAGECPLALGTQTIGSISRPASFCGTVGFKPSYDRIPRGGVIPLSPSLDHVGCFTETVAGARLAASVLCKEWAVDRPSSEPVLGIPVGGYLERADEDGQVMFAQICDRLGETGYSLERVEAMPQFAAIVAQHDLIVAAEAARTHERWFEAYADRYHPKTAELIERGRAVSQEALTDALMNRTRLRRELMVLMAENGVDLWISPASRGVAPRGLESTGDPVMNLPWTHAGLPTVVIPAATSAEGLPFGLQIAAGWWQDELLLEWSEGIEAALARA